MRTFWTSALLFAALLLAAAPARAVPITANYTPGGLMENNVGSNLKLWLRADALALADGALVSSWTDSTVNGYHATDGTNTHRPSFDIGTGGVLNGRATVVFNDNPVTPTATYLQNSTLLSAGAGHFTGNENATSFTVYRNPAPPPNDHLGIETTGSSPDAAIDLYQNSASYNGDFRSARLPGIAAGYPATGSHIKTVVSRDSNDSWLLFSDGRQRISAAAQTWGLNANFTIGRNTTHTSSTFVGEVGETLIYNTALNRAQQIIVENYLSSKYDVAIDGGGAIPGLDRYAGDTGGNGDYDYDVFGVGRYDSATNQHLNGGTQGFGIEVASLTNNEWVLAGHTTASNSLVPSEVDGQRWARVWYVDKTSIDGIDATLSFDFTDSGLSAPVIGDLTAIDLLYSATDPFSFSTLDVATTIDGDTISFTVPDALLLDGYYTLQIVELPEPGSGTLVSLCGVALAWRVRRRRR